MKRFLGEFVRLVVRLSFFSILFSFCLYGQRPCITSVDFNTAMKNDWQSYEKFNTQWSVTNQHWKKIKELYNEHIVDNPKYSLELRIPKIIHQIWLGSPFPEKSKKLRDTWLQHHPDWQYILWTEKEILSFGLVNKKLYDSAINYGVKSDIARYEILYRMGGLYVDTDFECLRSFDIFHHCCDFYTGFCISGKDFAAFNGLIASRSGHPLLEAIIKNLKNQRIFSRDSNETIMQKTGPYFFTKCIKEYICLCVDIIVLFPMRFFYPWPHHDHRNRRTRKEIESWFKPETFAVHHWHCSWQK